MTHFIRWSVCLAIGAALCLPPVLLAQTPLPQVLRIIREEVKPGKSSTHEQVESAWARTFAKANWATGWLGMTALSGPSEAWFLTGFDSLAAWEKADQDFEKADTLKAEDERLARQDGEALSNTRSLLAAYREDLSLSPSVNLPRMRYFLVDTIRVRPGHQNEYEAIRKMLNAAHTKAKLDHHHAVYEVTHGAPVGTFLMFTPMKSRDEDASPGFEEALGAEGQRRNREFQRTSLISQDSNLFSFNPKMSHRTKEWIAGDPDFWAPKPKAAPKPAAKPTDQ